MRNLLEKLSCILVSQVAEVLPIPGKINIVGF
jgi:hypothetical protein